MLCFGSGVPCKEVPKISQFRNQTSPHKALKEQKEEEQGRVSLTERGRRDPSSESCLGFPKGSRASRYEI